MESLLPDVPEPLRRFDVTVSVPREDDGDGLVPPSAPRGKNVVSAWTAEQAIMCVTVTAPGLFEAAVLGLAAAGEWAQMPGASAEVKPVRVRVPA